MDSSTYGERVADRYDDENRLVGAVADEVVARLVELAAPGHRVLELGIGTGRVALPLVARGLMVTGIDSSPKMLARLAAKPGGDKVRTVLGDMEAVGVDGEYDLVFVVASTFFALLTQAAQVACLTRAAARLAPGGKLLIEAFVPDHAHFDKGQNWRTLGVDDDRVVAESSRHDLVAQRVDTNLVYLTQDRAVDIVPIRIRYVHVAELDLMAQVAGLTLHARWAGWSQQPFGAAARQHVSVYVNR
ncbi:MAG TPA: class I SAM-dependent methyltransferase [Polyangia bacterium]|jgi:SAM-dependent methyltransferase|nr:class I SAM-dependent methyltransferase [Polyangia bacterium]